MCKQYQRDPILYAVKLYYHNLQGWMSLGPCSSQFRGILLGTNSSFNRLIEHAKYELYSVTDIDSVYLFRNKTKKYNNIVAK